MKAVALIPARFGSVRLPNKNMQLVGGKTLIHHAVSHAKEAGVEAFVSSEAVAYLDHAAVIGALGITRPKALATDTTPMMDVVRHAREWFRRRVPDVDRLVLLQPTSPCRTAEDILGALSLMAQAGADAVISVVASREPEVFSMGHAGRMRKAEFKTKPPGKLVVPNGAIFAITFAALDRGDTWWDAPIVYAYEMPAIRSIDIDTRNDLDAARRMMEP